MLRFGLILLFGLLFVFSGCSDSDVDDSQNISRVVPSDSGSDDVDLDDSSDSSVDSDSDLVDSGVVSGNVAEIWVSGIPGEGEVRVTIDNAVITNHGYYINWQADDGVSFFNLDHAPEVKSSGDWEEMPVDLNFELLNPSSSNLPKLEFRCSPDMDNFPSTTLITVDMPEFSGTLVCFELWNQESFVVNVRGDLSRALMN